MRYRFNFASQKQPTLDSRFASARPEYARGICSSSSSEDTEDR
jgi:hypothetical protein